MDVIPEPNLHGKFGKLTSENGFPGISNRILGMKQSGAWDRQC
jgi:hypothetical protein